jgi:hypothetical protein
MSDNLTTSYQQLIGSYQAIDSFRTQLLGLLPLATGGGILLLYNTNPAVNPSAQEFLPAIGLFGFVVTLGLFVYEIYGILKCTALILTGQDMERALGITGQFLSRPNSFLNEPFAAGLIYPGVLAAWAYVGLINISSRTFSLQIALVIFGSGLVGMLVYNALLLRGANGETE